MSNSEEPLTPATSPVQESPPAKKKWSTKKKVLVIIGALIAIFAALILFVYSATSAAVKISDQLIADIQSKNATAAYSLMSVDAKNATPLQDFTDVVNTIGPILNGKPKIISREVHSSTGKASTAKVVYEISATDGLTYTFTVNLTKEGADWKILNFDSTKKQASGSSSTAVSVNKDVQNKCLAEINDSIVCKFAGAFANVGDYKSVMTSVESGKTTVATIEIASNGNSSMTVKENGTTSAVVVSYGGSTYIRDESDMQWIKYSASNSSAPSVVDLKKEFVNADFKNSGGQVEQYINKGTEYLDGNKVYKYQVVDPSDSTKEEYLWFDASSYLLSKITTKDSTSTTTMTFSYTTVTISAPSPVKATL